MISNFSEVLTWKPWASVLQKNEKDSHLKMIPQKCKDTVGPEYCSQWRLSWLANMGLSYMQRSSQGELDM